MLPLDGLVVLDLAQYLAGPSAALRLADLGARVIKVERPTCGDGSRRLRLNGATLDGDSLLFHTINRGKESFAADLSDERDRRAVVALVERADVLVHSFRPGAIDKFGLDYTTTSVLNPKIIYAHVTGYGSAGPWAHLAGQDLLVQARSGLTWLNGSAEEPPSPVGLSVVDHLAGSYLVQGILACLLRRATTGSGSLIEVSLLEAAMDLQFEAFTTYLNGGGQPQRSAESAGHPYNNAPYGIYRTSDGWIALAMGSLRQLARLVGAPHLAPEDRPEPDFARRDQIKHNLAKILATRSTQDWLDVLEPAGFWCAEVRDWPALAGSGALDALGMVIEQGEAPRRFRTTRYPVRIDGQTLAACGSAPKLNQHLSLPPASSHEDHQQTSDIRG